MKYPQKHGRQRNLMTYCSDTATVIHNTIERWTKDCIFPFPKKSDLEIAKNYQGITLTLIVVKVYNTILLNCIKTKTEKILRKEKFAYWMETQTFLTLLLEFGKGIH